MNCCCCQGAPWAHVASPDSLPWQLVLCVQMCLAAETSINSFYWLWFSFFRCFEFPFRNNSHQPWTLMVIKVSRYCRTGIWKCITLLPVCSCIKIWPSEQDSVVKDPRLDDSLYSATCIKTNACPSSMVAMVDAASTRTCTYLIQAYMSFWMEKYKSSMSNIQNSEGTLSLTSARKIRKMGEISTIMTVSFRAILHCLDTQLNRE